MDITIKYDFFAGDPYDGYECETEIPDSWYDRLEEYEDDGELLDKDFISEEIPKLHKRILKAIKEQVEDYQMLDDFPKHKEKISANWVEVYDHESSKELLYYDMDDLDEDDLEYEVII
ncbi:MAG: hypothetical protein IJJ68_03730 [Prevotella sp.]|nr:hypothetical protein [Prevotella sp.]